VTDKQQDWGVPDWRDAKAYPKTNQISLTLWKWEFLRRDEGYRKDWLSYQAKGVSADAPKVYEATPEHREKYRLTSLPNPADPSPKNLYFWPTEARLFFGDEEQDGLVEIKLPDTHVAVVFDLEKSIPEQVRRVKDSLLDIQKKRLGHIKRTRGSNKWTLLLRILDAKASGKKFTYIGKELSLGQSYNTENASAREYYEIAVRMWKSINPH
jgi:hypothetical protein